MPTIVRRFDWPERVVVGTVGRPGERAFYLQVRDGKRINSVGLEKQQSAELADKLDELLDAVMAERGNPFSVPAQASVELIDREPLDQPVDADFRAGGLVLGWDSSTAQVVVEAYPLDDEAVDEGEYEPSEVLMVRMPVGTARAFVKRTRDIVRSGRPSCPRCGQPMDPAGHVCARPDGV